MPVLFVTGAAGFIGSALCRYLRANNLARVIGIDKMTYAASREALGALANDPHFTLAEADICNGARLLDLIGVHKPDGVIHLAAETHVDRSIDNPGQFLQTNIVGTFSLLEIFRHTLPLLPEDKRAAFRFLHVSTDEVYGSLGAQGQFTETTPYAPSSPYSASKAASDHLVLAWCKTYGLPVIIGNCSNNYGPFQFPEKLIPLTITKALAGEKLPVYGRGLNIRDWLFVEDHAEALWLLFAKGRIGEKYNVGGDSELRNIDLVNKLCAVLDELLPQSPHKPHQRLIQFVEDRPGHDARYAMDYSKLAHELGWQPCTKLEDGLRRTVAWYLENSAWYEMMRKRYQGERLGQKANTI